MSFFTQQTKKVEIAGPSGKNAVVVRKLTYGEQQDCISLATRIKVKGNKAEDADVDVDAARLQLEQMTRAVVSWEGPDFDRPLTPENLRALPSDVAQKISEGIDALNESMGDEEKGK